MWSHCSKTCGSGNRLEQLFSTFYDLSNSLKQLFSTFYYLTNSLEQLVSTINYLSNSLDPSLYDGLPKTRANCMEPINCYMITSNNISRCSLQSSVSLVSILDGWTIGWTQRISKTSSKQVIHRFQNKLSKQAPDRSQMHTAVGERGEEGAPHTPQIPQKTSKNWVIKMQRNTKIEDPP